MRITPSRKNMDLMDPIGWDQRSKRYVVYGWILLVVGGLIQSHLALVVSMLCIVCSFLSMFVAWSLRVAEENGEI